MRVRDTSKWPVGKIYAAPEHFTSSEVDNGLHVIQLGNQLLDILVCDRNSATTVVTFQHRVSHRSSFPTLVGGGFTSRANVNLVAIADPSVALDNVARLGWYLGNRAVGKLKPILTPIISTAVEALGTKRLIFFGNSGGGYPALEYGAMYPGSIGFTVNPMLGFNYQNERDFVDYMSGCHPGLGRTAYRRVYSEYAVDLAESIEKGADFHAVMYHNINDREYYEAHHKPFVETRKGDLQISERFESDDPGHTPIPKATLDEIIRELANTQVDEPTAVKNAGFIRAE